MGAVNKAEAASKNYWGETMKKLLLAFILLLSYSPIASALNLGEIRAQVRQIINDVGPVGAQKFSDDELNSKINIIHRDIAVKTDCLQYRNFIDVEAGESLYSIRGDFEPIKLLRAYYADPAKDGTYYPLSYTTRDKLAQDLGNFEMTAPSRPLEFYNINFSSTSVARIGVGLWPAPNKAKTGGLRVDYTAMPGNMSADEDYPFNSHSGLVGYHSTIIYGTVILSDRLLAGEYRALYNEGIMFMRENLKDLPAREGAVSPSRR